ncbi:MAG: hypothetical protein ACOYOS_17440 [Syntrophales bacterium]
MISEMHVTNAPSKTDGLVFHQDPVEDLLKIFDVAFRIVVPGPGRLIIGLKSISEKQNGAPGWYLWFEDSPGAYLLELADAGTKAAKDDGPVLHREAVLGLYRIKYYPDAKDASSLSLFSATEQAFRASDCFDGTGTPDFERGGDIPDPLFQIGMIEAGLSADGRGFVLRLGALDRWVTLIVEGLATTDEQGSTRYLRAAGEKDRDVPAWQLAWFLMDRLVLTLCLAYSSQPRQVVLHDAPGHAFRIRQGGVSQAVPYEAIRQRRLSISFRLHDGHSPCMGSLSFLSEDPSLLLESPPGKCIVSLCKEPDVPHSWVSSAWWHVRESHIDFSNVFPC